MATIDWSKLITAAMIEERKSAQHLEWVKSETTRLRGIADTAIAPLQDAVDLEEATPEEEAKLKLWKKYRVALNRLPDQPGYPTTITWPVMPE